MTITESFSVSMIRSMTLMRVPGVHPNVGFIGSRLTGAIAVDTALFDADACTDKGEGETGSREVPHAARSNAVAQTKRCIEFMNGSSLSKIAKFEIGAPRLTSRAMCKLVVRARVRVAFGDHGGARRRVTAMLGTERPQVVADVEPMMIDRAEDDALIALLFFIAFAGDDAARAEPGFARAAGILP